MDSDVSKDSYNSDSDIDEKTHSKLLENVLNLSKKKLVKKPTRTEATSTVSEFDLVKSSGNVRLLELAKGLGKSKGEAKLAKRLFKSTAETIRKPAEKIEADRSHRRVAYKSTQQALDKWDPIVTSMRAAPTLSFPLIDQNLEKDESKLECWRLKSELQQKLEEVDPKIEEIHVETNSFPLTLQEMLEKRQEAAKMRVKMGYELAKAKRLKKIKSKTYHRIQKRDKIKQQLKEFELLQKTDSEAALAKLEEIEKVRALERVSLRHKNTGAWAKNKQIRAKYNTDIRKVLANQLSLSKELTQKIKPKYDSDDEEAPTQQTQVNQINKDPSNPWTNSNLNISKEVHDFVSGYRKYWEEKNKMEKGEEENSKIKRITDCSTPMVVESVPENVETLKETPSMECELHDFVKDERLGSGDKVANKPSKSQKITEWKVEKVQVNKRKETKKIENKDFKVADVRLDQKLAMHDQKLQNLFREKMAKIMKSWNFKVAESEEKEVVRPSGNMNLRPVVTKPDLDEELLETAGNDSDDDDNENSDPLKNVNVLKTLQTAEEAREEIDPKKFIAPPKTVYLTADVPNLVTFNEEQALEENDNQVFAEAFEDDDVTNEFAKEKAEEIEKFNPKAVDLTLPGWGSWGGKNLEVPKKKRDKFTMKVPEKLKRRDDNIGHLIINETPNLKLRQHLVTEVPKPFKSVKDFESSIRQPLSNSFVPETVFRKLSAPKVTTKMGTIIKPMDEDVLLLKEKRAKIFERSFPAKDTRKVHKRRKSKI
ncbi:PREDICTED: U3 small nucleolar RNA-associated protein 14 homolog A [Nicrophorus vespilloides]|uniref:U3 small nucleolar RNA-associated protein 14 homolog A n=1 Tax=Nicrophorus vespilloides TaxID=110193 RepID=A0ABM1M1D5_NICVS|nr:PREDICTED: U3 small nucleolar RNA-associated protein 14 homolog A [Nicrophorus vespilloides]